MPPKKTLNRHIRCGMLLLLLVLLLLPLSVQARLRYLGVSVEKHPWRSTLTEWRESRDWIARVAADQLRVLPADVSVLTDPDSDRLYAALAGEAKAMGAGDVLLFYLGTHQLKDGRILLGERTETTAAALATGLAQLPGQTVLLADVCYAAAMDGAGGFSDSVVRIYAADADQKAPAIDLSGRFRGAVRFYEPTLTAMAPAPDGCSQFGMAFVDAVRIVLAEDGNVPVQRLLAVMSRRQAEFAKETRMTRTPDISGGNVARQQLRAASFSPGSGDGAKDPFAALDELLKKANGEIDPGLVNLLIGKVYEPQLDVPKAMAELDTMATALRPQLRAGMSPGEISSILADYLYKQRGLTAMPAPYPEDFLLHRLLATGKGRCAALTTLYLALTQRLGVDCHPVCVPEHIFVTAEVAGQKLNIETTLRGISLPDEKYQALAAKTAVLKDGAFYLTPLTQRQHAGTLLSSLASALRERGDLELAKGAVERAIDINPHDAEAWNNKGMILRLQADIDGAAAVYLEALRIYPAFAEAWSNLGVVQAEPAEKIRMFRKAVGYKPNLGLAWKNLAVAYDEAGQPDLAWSAVRRCAQLGVALPEALVKRVKPADE